MPLDKIPKITWGGSFANTLQPATPLDDPVAFTRPMDGHKVVKNPSGTQDAWHVGMEYVLEGSVRWIPSANTSYGGITVTGWDGATGWDAFLEWARDKNLLRFYPDKDVGSYVTCYLDGPMEGPPQKEGTGEGVVRLVLVNTSTKWTGYFKDY